MVIRCLLSLLLVSSIHINAFCCMFLRTWLVKYQGLLKSGSETWYKEEKIDSLVCFSVGDAVCTISAATCFPEPFISEGKRLGYVHRNFAGNRFSDHVALLSVFQAWDDAR